MSTKETLTKNEQVSAKKRASQKRFGMLPADVMANTGLTAGAKVVFAALAMESWSSGSVDISHQAIASLCGLSRMTVLYALRDLTAYRLIEAVGEPIKQIQCYRLLHPKLAAAKPLSESDRATPLACAKCGNVRKVNKACCCSSCATAARKQFESIDKRVKRQIERLRAAG